MTEIELQPETEEFKRFDLNGQIESWKTKNDELTARGGDALNRSMSEHQLRRNVKSKWLSFEQECDAHNVNEAFRLASEASQKEKLPFIRFYKGVIKGFRKFDHFSKCYSEPITWKKEWDIKQALS